MALRVLGGMKGQVRRALCIGQGKMVHEAVLQSPAQGLAVRTDWLAISLGQAVAGRTNWDQSPSDKQATCLYEGSC